MSGIVVLVFFSVHEHTFEQEKAMSAPLINNTNKIFFIKIKNLVYKLLKYRGKNI